MEAWPIEEVVLRPLVTLLACAIVPFLSAYALRAIFFSDPPADPDQRAHRLAPLRAASGVAGTAQLLVAFGAGATALGPAIVGSRFSWESAALGALCAAITFVAGGVARRNEAPASMRASIGGAIALRLRALAYFGPLVIGTTAAGALPIAHPGSSTPHWGFLFASFALCAFVFAYGGLAVSLATFAIRPAPPGIAALARDVAAREPTSLWWVLRLPTPGARFANAFAIPWARTLVVTDGLRELLDDSELRAVLAHEAGHLSEPWYVAASRVASVSIALFAIATGPRVAQAAGVHPLVGLAAAFWIAVIAILAARRLGRRMEERADERARANEPPSALASALEKIRTTHFLPMTMGEKRVHPDFYDRLKACGAELGERPAPPKARSGLLAGLAVAAMLSAAAVAAWTTTRIDPADVATAGADRARWRLRVDPWDADAMLASAWSARGDRARARLREARRMGATEGAALELEAELWAAEGDCDRARRTFDRALRARAEEVFAHGAPEQRLELGDYFIPPSLVSECDAWPAPQP